MTEPASVTCRIDTADRMVHLGRGLGRALRAGDLVVLTGDLGAGKTTLTRGIGQGLGVTEPVTSPTFVIARHHANASGPDLLHVDAYRLGSVREVEDLDLEADTEDCVTVVEWGEGVFGAEAASRHYFGIGAGQLNAPQSARLAVMLPAPRKFEKNPNSAYLDRRTQLILGRMQHSVIP